MIRNFCASCKQCKHRVGWVELATSILLCLFSIMIGILTHSKALIAMSLCSGIDVTTALMVLIGLKLSEKPINLKHPYGYGKIEFIIVGFISILVIVGSMILFYTSVMGIYHGEKGPDQIITLVTAFIIAGALGIKYKHSICAGKYYNSPAIITHANHLKMDMVSSLGVILGVLGARSGFHFVDPLVAIFDTIFIIKEGIHMLKNCVKCLLDTSIPQDKIYLIKKIATAVDGVRDINYIKARQVGEQIWIDLSVFVDPDITIFEAKDVAKNVKNYIIRKIEHIGNVQVQFLSYGV